MSRIFSLAAALAALCVTISLPASASSFTSGTSSQWKSLCADRSVSCAFMKSAQGIESYKVCSGNECFAVMCNAHSPAAICLKDEMVGARSQPRKIQAGIFDLLMPDWIMPQPH